MMGYYHKVGHNYVGVEAFTAVVMKSIIFWDVTPCSLLRCNRRSHLLTCWSCWNFFRPWRWRRYVPPKHPLHLNRLHGVTSQKMIHFLGHNCFLPLLFQFFIHSYRSFRRHVTYAVEKAALKSQESINMLLKVELNRKYYNAERDRDSFANKAMVKIMKSYRGISWLVTISVPNIR
jgi:hypothetical protein